MRTRHPAFAGSFYSSDRQRLTRDVEGYLDRGIGSDPGAPKTPRIIIAPHAGYVYSGPIAGSAFATLNPLRGHIDRVVLLGPSHYLDFDGIVTSGAETFETPLGTVPVDHAAEAALERLDLVRHMPEAHHPEHALEVELPFLQVTLGRFSIVPLLVGRGGSPTIPAVLSELWNDQTLIVVSSDLSHFLDYETARALDQSTAELVAGANPDDTSRIDASRACGFRALRGTLLFAAEQGLEGQLLDLRNSGDTAGDRDRVVGYGAFAFA